MSDQANGAAINALTKAVVNLTGQMAILAKTIAEIHSKPKEDA